MLHVCVTRLMLHVCATRFDVIGNLEKNLDFWMELNKVYILMVFCNIKVHVFCSLSTEVGLWAN